MLPWKRVELAIKRRFEALAAAVAELESAPAPEDHRPQLEALRRNLDGVVSGLGDLRNQVDLFPDGAEKLAYRLDLLESKVKDQTHAIAEGIERTARAERRIGQTVARARAELKKRGFSDPGVEAENRELHDLDGEGGDDGKLQAVREDVAEDDELPSSVPGVTLGQLKRARGL